jgi:hypothetical protein
MESLVRSGRAEYFTRIYTLLMTDLQPEFAAYIDFVTGVANLMRTAVTGGTNAAADLPEPEEIATLVTLLGSFGVLGEAIAGGDAREIAFVCTSHVQEFEGYCRPPPDHQTAQTVARLFERYDAGRLLEQGLELLLAIRKKAHDAIEATDEPVHGRPVLLRHSRA